MPRWSKRDRAEVDIPVESMEDIERAERRQRMVQQAGFGRWVLRVFIGQVLAVNAWIFIYAFANDWKVSGAIVGGWLTSTVANVIGLGLVAMKNLFPEPKA